MQPKVSVIIPVYNVANYLEECINSLINQTLKEIEIICVNDGSTDNSLEILKKFEAQDSRVKVFDKPNGGISSARNLALKNTTGEYLAFVDSDDWVDEDYFEKLYNAAIQNNCDIACAGFKRCRNKKKSIRKEFKKLNVYSDVDSKIKADNIPDDNFIWNKIYKHDKWNFTFEEGRVFEDMALSVELMFKLGDMVTVPNTFYNYRKNNDSASSAKTLKQKEDFQWALDRMYTFAKEHSINLNARSSFDRKKYIKLFNIPILKVYYTQNRVQYKLFGFIPFITVIEL